MTSYETPEMLVNEGANLLFHSIPNPIGTMAIPTDPGYNPSEDRSLVRLMSIHPHNNAIANIFLTMAERLQQEGANPFRVRAYRRASNTLSELDEDIALLAQRGDLDTLPGIGKDLSAKIQEYLRTGTIRAYEERSAPLPDFAKHWLQLPGFSEPIVNDLYFRLGIRSLEDLEALASSHLLRTRPGITATTEELLSAIQSLREFTPTD